MENPSRMHENDEKEEGEVGGGDEGVVGYRARVSSSIRKRKC
jgi:hypothetical protein